MFASTAALFPAIRPSAFALAVVRLMIVLLLLPLMSRYGFALFAPFGLLEVRLISRRNAGLGWRCPVAVLSFAEVPSLRSAFRISE